MAAERWRLTLYRALPLPARLKQRAAWLLSPRVRLGVHAIITDTLGRVLILRPTYAAGWQLPGGTVNAREPLDAALDRELREEIGTPLTEATLLSWEYLPDQRTVRAVYRVSIDAACIRLGLEHDRAWWCPPTLLPAHLAQIVRRALARQ